MAKEFKTTTKGERAATWFFKAELYDELVEVVRILGIPIGKNPRQLHIANKITQYVEKNCPDDCISEIENQE